MPIDILIRRTSAITEPTYINHENLFDIRDRVVVVTGGAGILGRSICHYLAGQGARVVILDRDEAAGEELVAAIREEGGEAMFLVTDVLNRDVLVSNRETILRDCGRIDVLLNAAGGNMGGATIAPTSRSSIWRSRPSSVSSISTSSARCCRRPSSARP